MSRAALMVVACALAGCVYDLSRPSDLSRPPQSDGLPQPDATPIVSLKWIDALAEAGCDSPAKLLSGGADCAEFAVKSMMPQPAGKYTAACKDTLAAGRAWAACGDLLATVQEATMAALTDEAWATCQQGELIGGGCDCSAGAVVTSTPVVNSHSWYCRCSQGPTVSSVVCAQPNVTVNVRPSCQADEIMVGGGCTCEYGLRSSIPKAGSPPAWSCRCTGDVEGTAALVCIR